MRRWCLIRARALPKTVPRFHVQYHDVRSRDDRSVDRIQLPRRVGRIAVHTCTCKRTSAALLLLSMPVPEAALDHRRFANGGLLVDRPYGSPTPPMPAAPSQSRIRTVGPELARPAKKAQHNSTPRFLLGRWMKDGALAKQLT